MESINLSVDVENYLKKNLPVIIDIHDIQKVLGVSSRTGYRLLKILQKKGKTQNFDSQIQCYKDDLIELIDELQDCKICDFL